MTHIGCIGDGCPHCPKLLQPGYEHVRANLTRQLPIQPETQPCRHRGSETGETVECASCGGSVRLKTFGCAVHRTCTIAKPAPGVVCCAGCKDFASPPADSDAIYVEVLPDRSGLGDHAVVLLTLAGVIAANPGRRVVLVTPSSYAASWMRLWWPDTILAPRPAGTPALQPLDQCPNGRNAPPRWAHAARIAGNVSPAVPALCTPLPPEHVAAVQPFAGAVVLAPEATSNDRVWPLPCWLELERLLLAAGRRVVILGQQASHLLRFASTPFVGQEPARVAALLQAAGCLVGNDGGPCHLAGLLGTRAIALCGLIGGYRVFGGYLSVRWIDGPLTCTGCEWTDPEPARYGCSGRCASLTAISPATVFEAVQQHYAPPAAATAAAPIAVVTAWDAAYDPLAHVTWPALVRYCARRGYTPVRAGIDPHRPASWSKLPALLAALDRHQTALWIDADAMIVGDADPLELLGNADAAVCHDENGLNAGVMIFRSLPWIKAALQAAWDAYPSWSNHAWWEQSALAAELAKRPERVRVVPRRVMNAYPGEPCDFILHTPGKSIAERLRIFAAAGQRG